MNQFHTGGYCAVCLKPKQNCICFKSKPKRELCVYCGVETEYPINTDVDLRSNYVEGAGQLCDRCYDQIYQNRR